MKGLKRNLNPQNKPEIKEEKSEAPRIADDEQMSDETEQLDE